MPALFSHATNAQVTVAVVLRDGLDSALAPRLSTVAGLQRDRLAVLLRDVCLAEGADTR